MMPPTRLERRERIALGAILVAALALRLYKLGQANLWWDEALAIWAVRKGFLGVTSWTASDVHPPLYFWSLWAWVKLFGESPFALRSLSALLGTATVWAVFGLGRRVGGVGVALLSAALTAVAPFAVWWSQEMRMYVLAGLLCTLSLSSMLSWLESEQAPADQDVDTRALGLSALYALGSLYTVFISAAMLIAQNLVVLSALIWGHSKDRRGMVLRWASSQLAILALLAPWLLYSWDRMPTWSVAQPTSPLFVARLYASLLSTGISEHLERATPATISFLTILLLGLLAWVRRRERERLTLWRIVALGAAVAVPGVFIYISTLPRGLFYSPHVEARYFYPFAPAFWTLLAWAAWQLGRSRRWLGFAAGGCLLAISMAHLPGYYGARHMSDGLQSMVRTIISQAQPDDLVLLDSGSRYPIFLYDYERLAPRALRPALSTISRAEERLDPGLVSEWMDAHATGDGRIWLAEVDVQLTDPERLVRAALSERMELSSSWQFGANALLLYSADGKPPRLDNDSYDPQFDSEALMGDGRLIGWDLPMSTYRAGEIAHLSLLWETRPTETVWVELATADGLVLLRRRLPETTPLTRQVQDIYLPAALPRTRLKLWLEDAAGQRLSLAEIKLSGARSAELIRGQPLGTVCDGLVLERYAVQSDTVAAGDSVVVDLYWRAQQPPGVDYTIFVHALGTAYNDKTAGPVWGQHDAPPQAGHWPTTQWQQGDMLLARHVIGMDEATPTGQYQVEIGLYDSESGIRARCQDSSGQELGDRILLEGFKVK